MSKHFKKTGENLFCQDFVIEGALAHSNQFLKKLDLEVNFDELWDEKLLGEEDWTNRHIVLLKS